MSNFDDDPTHLSDDRVEEAHVFTHLVHFFGGDKVEHGGFEDFRGVVVVLGGIDDGARPPQRGLGAQAMSENAVDAAGRPLQQHVSFLARSSSPSFFVFVSS